MKQIQNVSEQPKQKHNKQTKMHETKSKACPYVKIQLKFDLLK